MKKASLMGYTPPHALAGLAPNVPLAVACSGGADSVALLHLLKTTKRLGLPSFLPNPNLRL